METRRITQLHEDVKQVLRRLLVLYAVAVSGKLDPVEIQNLICLAAITRDGRSIDVSPLVDLFNCRICETGLCEDNVAAIVEELRTSLEKDTRHEDRKTERQS